MRPTLFITGAAGYVGRRLLELMPREPGRRVVLLLRDPGRLPRALRAREGVEVVEGDLLEPAGYARSLAGCEQVLHLAAWTGKGRRRDHFRVNVDGTRALLGAAGEAGVRGFLHVSTVAVGFEDRPCYWYAEAKARAEELVAASGLPFTIVRPTMVAGPGAPVLDGLASLASAPGMPMFGDGSVPVQPVFVDDLVAQLLELLDDKRFAGETLEIGGPEVLSLEELLARLRVACGGRRRRALHLPLRPVRVLLGWLEPLLLPVLPLTAGQLASFANAGTAADGPWLAARLGAMRGIDAALEGFGEARAGARATAALTAEASAFSRYLVGDEPGPYLLSEYLRFHDQRAGLAPRARIDRLLLGVARRLPGGVRLGDVYGSRFRKRGPLRAKLVLMLALLECSAPSARILDRPGRGGRGAALASMAAHVALEAVWLVVAAVTLLPLHAASAVLPGGRRGGVP